METKKFISTIKGFRTRFTNKPNADLEKKSVMGMVEKLGGNDKAIALCKESNLEDLAEYLMRVLGISKPKKSKVKSNFEEIVTGKDGKLYRIDKVKKTCKKVYADFADLDIADLEIPKMGLQVYQRYLKDHFSGEDCTIKKDRLYFRGYRISCDVENGFMVEDINKKYEVVATPFEGIPTPKELGDWFKKPVVVHTPEELKEAAERGKNLEKEREELDKKLDAILGPDYEDLRGRVLNNIKQIRSKDLEFDPAKFSEMIPFPRWQRKVKSLFSKWKKREIRYNKFLNELEKLTTAETFVVEEKKPFVKFVGTLLPDFNKVGMLVEDKIEVDGKWIDAVPFLLDYLLHHEPKAMYQIMKYAAGDITDVKLLENPISVDKTIEFNKRLLTNSAHNARLLCMVYDAVGLCTPQDLLYDADLEVGDVILISTEDGLKKQTVYSIEKGITLSKEIGLLKLDKWIKLPKKDEAK